MIDESKWVDVDSASRQHSRIRWVELPEEKQPDDDNYETYGNLVVDIKTHSNNDGVEYIGVPREIATRLLTAKEKDCYDSVFGEYVASVVDKKPVKLGDS